MLNMKSSYVAAALFVVVILLWMASGLLFPNNDETTSAAGNSSSNRMTVEVMPVELTARARNIELQGQLEPRRRLTLRAKTSGTVDRIIVVKGERIRAGELLVELDIAERSTELSEAEANVTRAISEQEAAASLRRQGLQSKLQLEQALAQLETARAQLARIKLEIENTRIRAPFSGVLSHLMVDNVRQQAVSELSIGQEVVARLITGQELEGRLSYISPVADSNTRSFAIEAIIPNSGEGILAGVSASLVIPVEQVNAAFIAPSVMALGEDGTLGVKLVDEQQQVRFVPITLISSSLDGAWVKGLEVGDQLITLGQGFVNVGQTVDARAATSSIDSSANVAESR